MNAAVDSGNGLSMDATGNAQDVRGLAEHGRQIQHDAEALAAHVRDATSGIQDYLTTQVEQRPLSTLGVAAGLGFMLGGGLSARLTVFLFGAATRLGAAVIAREVGARLSLNDWTGNPNRALDDRSEPIRSNHEN